MSGFSRIDKDRYQLSARQTWIDCCFTAGMIPLHPEHLRNFDYKGFHYYLLTWCCNYRQHHFTHADRVELVVAQFLRASTETDVEMDAYCFMSDHVHQMVHGRSTDADAKAYIHRAKQYSGYYFKKAFRSTLWQRYGHEEVIHGADALPRVVAYIIENPVRRGLVKRPEDYPFTGSASRTMTELLQWAYGPEQTGKWS